MLVPHVAFSTVVLRSLPLSTLDYLSGSWTWQRARSLKVITEYATIEISSIVALSNKISWTHWSKDNSGQAYGRSRLRISSLQLRAATVHRLGPQPFPYESFPVHLILNSHPPVPSANWSPISLCLPIGVRVSTEQTSRWIELRPCFVF
jgi:hypothetical protein